MFSRLKDRIFDPMNVSGKGHLWTALIALALAGLLALQAVWPQQPVSSVEERQFAEQVNLALRQTAHRLLALAGNHTGTIPPVQQEEKNVWLIRLEQEFDYDSLSPILREALLLNRVEGNYSVAVLDCQFDQIMLGYTANTQKPVTEIPCGGREQTPGCYNLRVTFPDRAATNSADGGSRLWATLACCLLLAYSLFGLVVFYRRKYLPGVTAPVPAVDRAGAPFVAPPAPNGQNALHFGRSVLYVDNQKLKTGPLEKDLTYREAKLLQLFGKNPNRLLERDHILKSVWEDEGILVGRSVDVFVSRLRKLLKDDDTITIVNVHGVGYRMEVKDNLIMG